jgi:two-component system response regulator BaeR
MNHILIIEDEEKIALLVSDYLKKEGFETTCHHNGDNSLELVKKIQPDLLLLDLMLPGMDGMTICKEIRKTSQMPIIMLTAKTDEIDRLIGLEIGADDYICKPFSPREVVARVKTVLRRAVQVADAPVAKRLVAGDIVMDEEAREVTVAGHSVTLTPSEFGLLQVMIQSPGRVFSRGELIDRVQGYHFDGYDRTVDSHVKNLRKKLAEISGNKEVITTIYGVGYKLKTD